MENTTALKSAIHNVPFRLACLASGVIALGALALNYTDNRPTVGYTQVCYRPSKEVKNLKPPYCTASQRYWVTDHELRRWERIEPEFYSKITRLKHRSAESTGRWGYGTVAFFGGVTLAGLGAARLNLLNRLAPGYRKEVQTRWHREAVRAGVQQASDVINGRYAVNSLQYQREIDFGRMQAGYLTPEEIQAQIEQANIEQAYLEGQQQAGLVQPEQQALPGQSLDEINNPSDKVTGNDQQASIKPALIQVLEDSAIAPILKAGVLKVIGSQGSGKTTLVNGGLLRYRLHQGHKFIIINPHKKFEMYSGLESLLEPGTKFYAVGKDDAERANSLVDGMKVVLSLLQKRYGEYQNQPVGTYKHYPVTVLLEECGEWLGLLGEKGISLIQSFWMKVFIASRKVKVFPIITAQHDTMAMFGNPKGLAELIKNTGTVTVKLEAKPDPNSPDGWSPTGKGLLALPSQDILHVEVPDIRNLVANPDTFTDLKSPHKTHKTNNNNRLEIARSLIADCWDAPDAEQSTKQPSKLSENAQSLIDYMKRNNRIKAYPSDIQPNFKVKSKRFSVREIKGFFDELIQAELASRLGVDGIQLIDKK